MFVVEVLCAQLFDVIVVLHNINGGVGRNCLDFLTARSLAKRDLNFCFDSFVSDK